MEIRRAVERGEGGIVDGGRVSCPCEIIDNNVYHKKLAKKLAQVG